MLIVTLLVGNKLQYDYSPGRIQYSFEEYSMSKMQISWGTMVLIGLNGGLSIGFFNFDVNYLSSLFKRLKEGRSVYYVNDY